MAVPLDGVGRVRERSRRRTRRPGSPRTHTAIPPGADLPVGAGGPRGRSGPRRSAVPLPPTRQGPASRPARCAPRRTRRRNSPACRTVHPGRGAVHGSRPCADSSSRVGVRGAVRRPCTDGSCRSGRASEPAPAVRASRAVTPACHRPLRPSRPRAPLVGHPNCRPSCGRVSPRSNRDAADVAHWSKRIRSLVR